MYAAEIRGFEIFLICSYFQRCHMMKNYGEYKNKSKKEMRID
jgi:hypothetical protein